jgi:hypothetical protein
MTQAPPTLADLFDGQSDSHLFQILTIKEAELAASPADQSLRLARGWLITELQRRLPKAAAHLNRLHNEADIHFAESGEVTEIDYLAELAKFTGKKAR